MSATDIRDLLAEAKDLTAKLHETGILIDNAWCLRPGLMASQPSDFLEAPVMVRSRLSKRLFKDLPEELRRALEADPKAISGLVSEPEAAGALLARFPGDARLRECVKRTLGTRADQILERCLFEPLQTCFPRLANPVGYLLVMEEDDIVLATEPEARTVHKYSLLGESLASYPLDQGILQGLFAAGNDCFYVCDALEKRLLHMTTQGELLENIDLPQVTRMGANCPSPYCGGMLGSDVVVMLVSNSARHQIVRFDPSDPAGTCRRLDTECLAMLYQIWVSSGILYASDAHFSRIFFFDESLEVFKPLMHTGVPLKLYRTSIFGESCYSVVGEDILVKTSFDYGPVFATKLDFMEGGNILGTILAHEGRHGSVLYVASDTIRMFRIAGKKYDIPCPCVSYAQS